MQTILHFGEFDALCVDGPLAGRLYAHDAQRFEHIHYLGPAGIPYRAERSEAGEWFFSHAKELDPTEDF